MLQRKTLWLHCEKIKTKKELYLKSSFFVYFFEIVLDLFLEVIFLAVFVREILVKVFFATGFFVSFDLTSFAELSFLFLLQF